MKKPKWVNIEKLSSGGKLLVGFEPDEVVRVKGARFMVTRVVLDPPLLTLVPLEEGK